MSPTGQMLSKYHRIRPSFGLIYTPIGLKFCTYRPPVANLHASLSKGDYSSLTLKNAHGTTGIDNCVDVKPLKNCI